MSDALIREAILREIDRQGQVYFLHNRVYNIDYMARHIGQLVPEARVGVGHGQMNEGELEDVMLDFAEGNLDVLVCTTIIESGLDIPECEHTHHQPCGHSRTVAALPASRTCGAERETGVLLPARPTVGQHDRTCREAAARDAGRNRAWAQASALQ